MRIQRTMPANLFKVVDFPDEGLPTSPINGSRGISSTPAETDKESRCTSQSHRQWSPN